MFFLVEMIIIDVIIITTRTCPVAGRGNVGWRPCGELGLTEFIVSIIFVILVVDTNARGYFPSQDHV